MNKLKALLVLALGVAIAAPAYAETQNVKVSGSIDAYAFSRNSFDFNGGNDAGTLSSNLTGTTLTNVGSTVQRSEGNSYFMSITQIGVNADMTDNVSTVINLVNQRDWNADTPGTVTTNTTEEFDVVLDLAYVQLKEIFYAPLTLTIGRQDIVFGRGFIIGWNPQDPTDTIEADEFTQLQAFDAIRATLDFNPWTVDLVYSKINENAHNAEDDRDLYIANVNYKFAEYNAVAEGYYINEADRHSLVPTGGATGDNVTHMVGGRVQFDPISQITLGGELAYQFGDYRGATASRERDRQAWAFDIFGEYRFADSPWKPMLGLEYVYLSGESDLSASTASYGAWNGAYRGPVYGWIHDYKEIYYSTTATNDQVAGQNQQHVSIYGSIYPMTDLKLAANYFRFWAAEDMHTVTASPTSSVLSDHIGDEIDTAVVYSYTEDVTFSLLANWFIPGELYSSPNDETASEYVSQVKVVF